MRHPLVPALLVVLAVVVYALLGAVVAGASPAPGTPAEKAPGDATVTSTETDDDPVGSLPAASDGPDVPALPFALVALALGLAGGTDRR